MSVGELEGTAKMTSKMQAIEVVVSRTYVSFPSIGKSDVNAVEVGSRDKRAI
jgi:hypothetical protein